MELENLITLINTISASEVTGFQYEQNGMKLKISKTQKRAETEVQTVLIPAEKKEAATAAEETALPDPEGQRILSPLVGTFYAAPAEDAEPFAAVGNHVKKGQTLAIVEAMKLMNEIESDYDGILEEIYVENGQAVEYGQPLFRIR